jgi:hypothetical protein
MKPIMQETRIRYQVHFAPDPANPAYPTTSRFVDSGLVRDITEFPRGVKYVSIGQVAEVEFVEPVPTGWIRSPSSKIMRTGPFNEELFHVTHSAVDAARMRETRAEIEVHPSLEGKVWVFGDKRQADDQRAAA